MGQKCFYVIPRAGAQQKRAYRTRDTVLVCGRRNARRMAKHMSQEYQAVSGVVEQTGRALAFIALYKNGRIIGK